MKNEVSTETRPCLTNAEFRAWLTQRSACEAALAWLGDRDEAQAWQESQRGDWLLWWAAKRKIDRKVLVLAACASAHARTAAAYAAYAAYSAVGVAAAACAKALCAMADLVRASIPFDLIRGAP